MQVAYLAIDAHGQEIRGSVEADGQSAAATELKRRGLFPVELHAGAAPRTVPARPGFSLGLVRTADKVLFLSQMALMLRSGLTLLNALGTFAEQAEKAGLRRAAQRLSDALQRGQSLSDALEAESRLFPPVVSQLVRTAEATGQLDEAFQRAADYLERAAELRFQVLTSLTYPSIVLVVSFAVFWFLTTNVVPKIARFLLGRSVELPWSTQLLLDISGFVSAYGPQILGSMAATATGILIAYRTAAGRLVIDRICLAIPVVGGVLRASSLAHLCRTLSMLLRSGLTMLESLTVLAPTFHNRCYVNSLEQCAEKVVRGNALSTSLRGAGITALTTQVIAVGENSGSLDDTLAELASYYDRLLQRRIKTLAGLIEPVLLLIVGGMVGLVYLAFFQAVFQLASR